MKRYQWIAEYYSQPCHKVCTTKTVVAMKLYIHQKECGIKWKYWSLALGADEVF